MTILGKIVMDGAILKTVILKIVVVLHVKIKIGDQVKHSSSHAPETLKLLCQNK